MTVDAIVVGGLPITVTLSRKIKLVTTEYTPSRKAGQLAKSLRKIVKLYAKGRCIVRLALMDNKFNKIEDLVGLLETNTTATREHVGKIKREIRLIKERTRCITTGFPYHWIPNMVIIHTIYGVCMWLNEFLPNT